MVSCSIAPVESGPANAPGAAITYFFAFLSCPARRSFSAFLASEGLFILAYSTMWMR
jgi:hypothetical protein